MYFDIAKPGSTSLVTAGKPVAETPSMLDTLKTPGGNSSILAIPPASPEKEDLVDDSGANPSVLEGEGDVDGYDPANPAIGDNPANEKTEDNGEITAKADQVAVENKLRNIMSMSPVGIVKSVAAVVDPAQSMFTFLIQYFSKLFICNEIL